MRSSRFSPTSVLARWKSARSIASRFSGTRHIISRVARTVDTPLPDWMVSARPDWQTRYGRCVPDTVPVAVLKSEDGPISVQAEPNVMSARSRWWTVNHLEKVGELRGATLMGVALQECAMCPVQHACCAHAIENEEFDIWACSEADRTFLREQVADWHQELRSSQQRGETVQAMVARLKQEKRSG